MPSRLYSFRSQLLALFVGLVLLVALPLGVHVTHRVMHDLVAEKQSSVQSLALAVATVLGEDLQNRQREIELLAKMPHFRSDALGSPSVRGAIDLLQGSVNDYSWIGVLSVEGRVLTATGNLLQGQSLADRQWFRQGLSDVAVGDVHDARSLRPLLPEQQVNGRLYFIDFAAPIHDQDHKVRGVLGAHLHWRWAGRLIASVLQAESASSGNEVFILNSQGRVIFPQKYLDDADLDDLLRGPADADNYISGAASVSNAGKFSSLGWHVVVRQPREVVLASVRQLQYALGLAGVLSVLVFVALAFWLARRLSHSLERLSDWSVQSDQLDVPLALNTRISELAKVGQSMEAMKARWLQGRREIEAINASLEQLVQQRTAELEQVNRKLEALVRTDPLTEIHNRRAADERLQHEWRMAKRNQSNFSVLMMDVDHFKQINDSHGHAIGDKVIRRLAWGLQQAMRATDFLARFGGEEFLMILPDTDLAGALRKAEDLRVMVEQMEMTPLVRVTVSIGVAMSDGHEERFEDVWHVADKQLYRAKKLGRNRVEPALPAS